MNLSKVLLSLTGCLFAASLTGCVVTTSDPVGVGSLSISVTLNDRNTSSECDFYGVDRIEMNVLDDFGDRVAAVNPPCTDLGVTVENLEEGFYTVEATLLDSGGAPRSDQVIVEDLHVTDGIELAVLIDFPGGAIYP
jgi:hypothetical protein